MKAWDRICSQYARPRDRILRAYDVVLRRAPSMPLPIRRKQRQVRPTCLPEPFWVRPGTSDFVTLEQVLFADEYLAMRKLAPEKVDVILDLGSNIGASVRLWQSWWPGARTIAVEPDPDNFSLLLKNTQAISAASKCVCVQTAASASNGRLFLDRAASEWEHHVTDRGGHDRIEVSTTSVSQLLSDHVEPGARIDVLKCDIEGSETEVFKDCSSWIRRVRCMAVEVHNPYRAANLRDDLCRSHALIHDFSISSEGDRYQVVVVRFDHDD